MRSEVNNTTIWEAKFQIWTVPQKLIQKASFKLESPIRRCWKFQDVGPTWEKYVTEGVMLINLFCPLSTSTLQDSWPSLGKQFPLKKCFYHSVMSTQKNWLFQVALNFNTELKETCALCRFVLFLSQVFLPQQTPYQDTY